MLPVWTVPTNHNLGTFEEREALNIALPLESFQNITTKIISGSIPDGLRLKNNRIVGRALEVSASKLSNFVIRATSASGISDRTFNITINGPDSPSWVTPEGKLTSRSKQRFVYSR